MILINASLFRHLTEGQFQDRMKKMSGYNFYNHYLC